MPVRDQEQTFIEHLVELRTRLLKAVLAVVIVFLGLLPFSRRLYAWLAEPLVRHLPDNQSLIAIDIASPFLTPMKLTFLVALLIAVPVVLYQCWAFVAPALYDKEKRLAKPLFFSSVVLFYAGCAFAYFVVLPLVYGFFAGFVIEGVAYTPDIKAHLDFAIALFLAFGIAFQVPIVTIVLVATRLVSIKRLSRIRPYIVLACFIIGMFLTPPDVISQTLLAIPMWLLYELGIIFSRALLGRRVEDVEKAAQP